MGSSAGLWGQAQGDALRQWCGVGGRLGQRLGGGGHLTWGCAPGLQPPGPARPPPTARPWRSQSQPPLSHLPGPPAGNGLGQQRTSAHSSSVCLWMRGGQRVKEGQKPPTVWTSPALVCTRVFRLYSASWGPSPSACPHVLWISMTFSSVATALMLGFCCKTASSKGCSWQGKEEQA